MEENEMEFQVMALRQRMTLWNACLSGSILLGFVSLFACLAQKSVPAGVTLMVLSITLLIPASTLFQHLRRNLLWQSCRLERVVAEGDLAKIECWDGQLVVHLEDGRWCRAKRFTVNLSKGKRVRVIKNGLGQRRVESA